MRHLFDHTANVHRATETTGTLNVSVRTWTPVAASQAVDVAIQPRREAPEDRGPGEIIAGEYRGFARPELDVQEQDVLEVTAGPEAPLLLKVEGRARPRGHHTELTLTAWEGSLA